VSQNHVHGRQEKKKRNTAASDLPNSPWREDAPGAEVSASSPRWPYGGKPATPSAGDAPDGTFPLPGSELSAM